MKETLLLQVIHIKTFFTLLCPKYDILSTEPWRSNSGSGSGSGPVDTVPVYLKASHDVTLGVGEGLALLHRDQLGNLAQVLLD
jgi:hypothetical protein